MVEIISKSSDPHPQDARVRRLIDDNRATITRLADHLSQGAYSAGKKPKQQPQAKGIIFHGGGGPAVAEPEPAVRISLNGRVIVVDERAGRQMHHLGEVRRRDGADVFVLATKANGFFSPVENEIGVALQDLDGRSFTVDFGEEQLVAEIARRLGMS